MKGGRGLDQGGSDEIYISETKRAVPNGGMGLFVKVIRIVGNYTHQGRSVGFLATCVLCFVKPAYFILFFSCFCWYIRPSAWAIISLTVQGASGS